MAQLILIVGIVLSYIASLLVAILMSEVSEIGIGTRFMTALITYNMFSLIFKVLWKRKKIVEILYCIGALIISHVIIACVSSVLMNLMGSLFAKESYLIFAIIGAFIIIVISGIVLSLASSYFETRYNIEKERKKIIEDEKRQEEEIKSLKEAKLALFNIGDNVIYEPMNRKMIIKEFTNDWRIVCVSYKNGKEEYEGTYKPEQIKKAD